jgi:hypothetical protein
MWLEVIDESRAVFGSNPTKAARDDAGTKPIDVPGGSEVFPDDRTGEGKMQPNTTGHNLTQRFSTRLHVAPNQTHAFLQTARSLDAAPDVKLAAIWGIIGGLAKFALQMRCIPRSDEQMHCNKTPVGC